MKILVTLLLLLTSSTANAHDWIARPAPIGRCQTYLVPVADHYLVVRNKCTGQVYSREYIGTSYEHRTYCTPRPRLGFEPWFNDLDRWSTDTGYGEYR